MADEERVEALAEAEANYTRWQRFGVEYNIEYYIKERLTKIITFFLEPFINTSIREEMSIHARMLIELKRPIYDCFYD